MPKITLATDAKEKGWIPRETSFKAITYDEILDSVSYSAKTLPLTFEYVKEKPHLLKFKVPQFVRG